MIAPFLALPPPPQVPDSLLQYSYTAAVASIPVLVLYGLSAPITLPGRNTTAWILTAFAIIWQVALVLHYPTIAAIPPFLLLFWIPVALLLTRSRGIGTWESEISTPIESLLLVQGLAFFWMLWTDAPRTVLVGSWALLLVEWFCYSRWEKVVYDRLTREQVKHWLNAMGFEIPREVHVRAETTFTITPSEHGLGTSARVDTAEQIQAAGHVAPRVPFGVVGDDDDF